LYYLENNLGTRQAFGPENRPGDLLKTCGQAKKKVAVSLANSAGFMKSPELERENEKTNIRNRECQRGKNGERENKIGNEFFFTTDLSPRPLNTAKRNLKANGGQRRPRKPFFNEQCPGV